MTKELTKTETGLIEIKPEEVPAKLVKNGLDEYIEGIRSKVAGFEGDTSTAKGRAAIKSMAFAVIKSKTFLEKAADLVLNSEKAKIADVNALIKETRDEKKRASEELTKIANEIRRPVTDFEEADKKRKDEIKEKISILREFSPSSDNGLPVLIHNATADQIEASIKKLETMSEAGHYCSLTKEVFGESLSAAQDVHSLKIKELKSTLDVAKDKEALEAEKAKIKAEENARKQKERDEKLQREAAEKATKEAESKRVNALEKRVDDLRRLDWAGEWINEPAVLRALKMIEDRVIDGSYEEFQKRAQEIKDVMITRFMGGVEIARKRDAKELGKAELEAAEIAERKQKEFEERKDREAKEAQQKKDNEEREAAKKEEARRQNKEHRAKINAQVKKDLVDCLRIPGLAEDEKTLNMQATKLLTAIGIGRVNHFGIEY